MTVRLEKLAFVTYTSIYHISGNNYANRLSGIHHLENEKKKKAKKELLTVKTPEAFLLKK